MISISDLIKEYPDGQGVIRALTLPKLEIGDAEQWALVGPSGSGKSTLLHILSGLTKPTSGKVSVDGVLLNDQTPQFLADWRGKNIGYVLQTLSLLPSLNAFDNILSGAYFAGLDINDTLRHEVKEMLKNMGLGNMGHKKPEQLSQGQQQRVAIARSLIKKPKLILADEPSASLDKETSNNIMDILINYANSNGATLLISTHDPEVRARFNKEISLAHGVHDA